LRLSATRTSLTTSCTQVRGNLFSYGVSSPADVSQHQTSATRQRSPAQHQRRTPYRKVCFHHCPSDKTARRGTEPLAARPKVARSPSPKSLEFLLKPHRRRLYQAFVHSSTDPTDAYRVHLDMEPRSPITPEGDHHPDMVRTAATDV